MKFTLTEVDDKGNKISETKLDMNITEKELDEYDKLFCKCDYLKNNPEELPEYVENYKGVKHGWICPECKLFTQIG